MLTEGVQYISGFQELHPQDAWGNHRKPWKDTQVKIDQRFSTSGHVPKRRQISLWRSFLILQGRIYPNIQFRRLQINYQSPWQKQNNPDWGQNHLTSNSTNLRTSLERSLPSTACLTLFNIYILFLCNLLCF